MKVIIAGKGGSGKSTVVALAARGLAEQGFHVLVVDTDESNLGLSRMLQLSEPQELMEGLGGRKEVGRRIRESRGEGASGKIFDRPWTIGGIPSSMVSRKDGVSMIQTGKIKEFGEGCACAMGMLSQGFLKNLQLSENEFSLVDTEAGVEHMGRGMEREADLTLAVLDPSLESIELLKRMKKMNDEAGKPMAVVLNRIDPRVEGVMRMAVKGYDVAANIYYDEAVLLSGLDGSPLPSWVPGSRQLTDFLIGRKEGMAGL